MHSAESGKPTWLQRTAIARSRSPGRPREARGETMPSRGLQIATVSTGGFSDRRVIVVRRSRERRAHRDHLGDGIGMALGQFARDNAAEAPADQHHRLAISLANRENALGQLLEQLGRNAEIEPHSPAFGLVPGAFELVRHVAHPPRARPESRQQHDDAARLGAGDRERGMQRPAERLGHFAQFAQQETQCRVARALRLGPASERDAARDLAPARLSRAGHVAGSAVKGGVFRHSFPFGGGLLSRHQLSIPPVGFISGNLRAARCRLSSPSFRSRRVRSDRSGRWSGRRASGLAHRSPRPIPSSRAWR